MSGGPMAGPKPLAFFIYNPTISTKEETAYENILYYWPPSTDPNIQMNEAGLCTAIDALQGRFMVEGEAEKLADLPRSITTGHKRYTIRRFEPNFFFVLVTNRGQRFGHQSEAHDRHSGDHQKSVDYLLPFPRDQSDNSIETVADAHMTIYYRTFVMLCGKLQLNLSRFMSENRNNAAVNMRRLLTRNLARWLIPNVQTALTSTYNYAVGSFATPSGIEYVAPSQEGYLVVSSLLARIQSAVPVVRQTAVSYQGKALFSSLSLENTFTLFQLLPALFDQRGDSSVGTGASATTSHLEQQHSTPDGRGTSTGGRDFEFSPTFAEHMKREEAVRNSVAGSRPTFASGRQSSPGRGARAANNSSNTFHDFTSDTQTIGFATELKDLHASFRELSSIPATSDGTNGTGVAPSLMIDGQLIGLLTCPVRSMRILLLVDYAHVVDPVKRAAVMEAVHSIVTIDGEQLIKSVVVPSLKSSRSLDERFVYFYANRMNLAVKTSILNRKAATTFGSRDDELGAIHLMDVLRHAIIEWKAMRHTPDIKSDFLSSRDGVPSAASTGVPSGGGGGHSGRGRSNSGSKISSAVAAPVTVTLTGGGVELAPYSNVDERVSSFFRVKDNIWLLCRQSGDREFFVAVDGSNMASARERAQFVEDSVFYENFSG